MPPQFGRAAAQLVVASLEIVEVEGQSSLLCRLAAVIGSSG